MARKSIFKMIVGKLPPYWKIVALYQRNKKYTNNGKLIKNNKIVFIPLRRNWSCNPKYIAIELLRKAKEQGQELDLWWLVDARTDKKLIPDGIKTFPIQKIAAVISDAHIVVDNGNYIQRYGVGKKPGQVFLQTWHGSLGIKRLDASVVKDAWWKRIRKLCVAQTDYLIVDSKFEEDVFAGAYWPGVEARRLGKARNDLLYYSKEKQEAMALDVLRKLNLDEKINYLLVAPTHFDGINFTFEIDYAALKEALEKKFGGQWEFLLRFHNNNRKEFEAIRESLPDIVHDVQNHADIGELFLISAAGLSNYSSWIFDYMQLRRPVFIYNPTDPSRDFYFPFSDTPFEDTADMQSLVDSVAAFDQAIYEKKVAEFLQRMECVNDGKAGTRTADLIISFLSEDRRH